MVLLSLAKLIARQDDLLVHSSVRVQLRWALRCEDLQARHLKHVVVGELVVACKVHLAVLLVVAVGREHGVLETRRAEEALPRLVRRVLLVCAVACVVLRFHEV